jgi:hypothetical protein
MRGVPDDDGDAMNPGLDTAKRSRGITDDVNDARVVEGDGFTDRRKIAVQQDVVVVSRGAPSGSGAPSDGHDTPGDDLATTGSDDIQALRGLAMHCQHDDCEAEQESRNTTERGGYEIVR